MIFNFCPDFGNKMPTPSCDDCFFAGERIERYEYLHEELQQQQAERERG